MLLYIHTYKHIHTHTYTHTYTHTLTYTYPHRFFDASKHKTDPRMKVSGNAPGVGGCKYRLEQNKYYMLYAYADIQHTLI
jgi:hypothetical protein